MSDVNQPIDVYVSFERVKQIVADLYQQMSNDKLSAKDYPWISDILDHKSDSLKYKDLQFGPPIFVRTAVDITTIDSRLDHKAFYSSLDFKKSDEYYRQNLDDFYYVPICLKDQRMIGYFKVPIYKPNGREWQIFKFSIFDCQIDAMLNPINAQNIVKKTITFDEHPISVRAIAISLSQAQLTDVDPHWLVTTSDGRGIKRNYLVAMGLPGLVVNGLDTAKPKGTVVRIENFENAFTHAAIIKWNREIKGLIDRNSGQIKALNSNLPQIETKLKIFWQDDNKN